MKNVKIVKADGKNIAVVPCWIDSKTIKELQAMGYEVRYVF